MSRDIACPSCGEEERLAGARSGEVIRICCEACGETWARDPRPTCPRCGGDDLAAVPKAVVEKVRGDQMSVVGAVTVQLCRACDRELVDRHARSGAPLPPDALPVTSRHGWSGAR